MKLLLASLVQCSHTSRYSIRMMLSNVTIEDAIGAASVRLTRGVIIIKVRR